MWLNKLGNCKSYNQCGLANSHLQVIQSMWLNKLDYCRLYNQYGLTFRQLQVIQSMWLNKKSFTGHTINVA